MDCRRLLFLGCVTLVMTRAGEAVAQERPMDLHALVSNLDLSERGAAKWLQLLETNPNGALTERLLAVTTTGERLMGREGGPSSVRVGAELDVLLQRPGNSIVLIHNHPSNGGLSANDIGQLVKPGVAAIVAIGHDGSVFVAAPARRIEPNVLEEQQYPLAQFEVQRRLRAAGPDHLPMRHAPEADSGAQLCHLVARALEKVGIIEYWFALRGATRESYDRSRVVFGQAVENAAARLKRLPLRHDRPGRY